jgi:hypothetical protein
MTRHIGRLLSSFAVLLAAAMGCHDGINEPVVLSANRYALVSVDGNALPRVAWVADNYVSYLVGDTLTFNGNGTGEENLAYRFESNANLEEPGQLEVIAFTYTISRSTIKISLACPGIALCAEPPHYVGTIADGKIMISSTVTAPVVRVYEPR